MTADRSRAVGRMDAVESTLRGLGPATAADVASRLERLTVHQVAGALMALHRRKRVVSAGREGGVLVWRVADWRPTP